MKHSLVSIIIPVYNIEYYLRECLDSILAQTYENIEVILVDDGSTDTSASICMEYRDKDKRVRFFSQSNSGVSAARNNALDKAKGEYILFVDGDDIVAENIVESLVRNMSKNVHMSICGFVKFTDSISFENQIRGTVQLSQEKLLKELFYGDKIGSGPFCKLIRKTSTKNIRFDEKLALGEDLDFLCKLIFANADFESVYIPQQLYGYRVREGSAMTRHYDKNYWEYFKNANDWGRKTLLQYPGLKEAVGFRVFGVASYCIGKIGRYIKGHESEYNEYEKALRQNSRYILLDKRSSAKDRCLALAYLLVPKLASRLRRFMGKA